MNLRATVLSRYAGGRSRLPASRTVELLALVTILLLSGCSTRFIRGHAERRIRRKLVDLVGPAERYQVRIRGTKDAEIVAGRIRRIDIDGWNVLAGHQIELETLHLELQNVHYHPPPEEVVSVGESHLVIQLTQEALNDYFRRQHTDGTPEITLNAGTVTLRSSMALLGVPTPLLTTGHLEIVGHTRLIYRADTVRLSTDPIPGVGPEYVESHLNPLLNVSRLNLPLSLDEVEVQPGRLILRGSASLPPTSRHHR